MVQFWALFSTSSWGGSLLALGLGLMLGWLAWCRPKTRADVTRRLHSMRDENAQLRALLRATQASAPVSGLLDPALGQGAIDRKTLEADLKHHTSGIPAQRAKDRLVDPEQGRFAQVRQPALPEEMETPAQGLTPALPVIHEVIENDRLADGELDIPDIEETLARPAQSAGLISGSEGDLLDAGIAASRPTEHPLEPILEHILELEENLTAMRTVGAMPAGHAMQALPNMVQVAVTPTQRGKASRSLD